MFRLRWKKPPGSGETGQRTVSLHITSSVSGRAYHRTVSWGVVRVAFGLALLLVLFTLTGIGGLIAWVHSADRMQELQETNDSLRVEFLRLGQLEDDLAHMSQLNDKMKRMLGVDLPGVESTDGLVTTGDGMETPPGGQ